jgi:ABC-2 type transport system permease protein
MITHPPTDVSAPNGGPLGLLALHAWTDLRTSLRSVEFAVGLIGIPVLLYVMFGLPADTSLPGGTAMRAALLVSFCAYGVVSLAIFTFGERLAAERERGWTRTLRATPVPVAVPLLGRVGGAVVEATMIVVATGAVAAFAGGVTLSPRAWLGLWATMAAGLLVFSTLGFAIALVVSPRSASAIANLIFLPLAFASGFFKPLSELPAPMRDVAPWLPTFHFGQLAYRVVMPRGDVEAFTGVDSSPLAVHVAWLVASFVLFGTVALVAARREAVTRRV